jgi:DNA-binding transcriptional ArsR family regulator
MSDKITLDRETFKVLAADTRVDILKRLAEHKLTLTDLSQLMGMSPSTIKEHLDRLVDVGLIEQMDRGMKWKYYRLTSKGRDILSPYETKVWILLGTSVLVAAGSALSLAGRMTGAMSKAAVAPMAQLAEEDGEVMARAAGEAVNESVRTYAAKAPEAAADVVHAGVDESVNKLGEATTTTLVERVVETLPPAAVDAVPPPVLELALLVAALVAVGFCVGYLMKKRFKIV